jgi:hypothetical protein
MKYLFSFIFIFSCHAAYASSATRENLEIDRFHPMSLNRPAGPGNQGASRVYFTTSGAWGGTNCRIDSADIQVNDTHILSSLLMAFAAGKTMTIEVDDTLEASGSVCKITAAYINR